MKALLITSYCFKENGDLITGDSNGNIYTWLFEEARITQAVKHGHEVRESLCFVKNNTIYILRVRYYQ
jgi:hypothetical protein